MEDRKGLLSHVGGIVRIVLFIILIAVVVFFAVKFIRSRQNSNKANKATQTVQEKETQDRSSKKQTRNTSDKADKSTDTPSDNNQNSVPSGIADTQQTPSTGPQSIPETGTGTSIFITAVTLSAMVYIVTLRLSAKRLPLTT